MKAKIWITVGSLIFFTIVLGLSSFIIAAKYEYAIRTVIDHNIDNYESHKCQTIGAYDLLPELIDLDNSSDISFEYKRNYYIDDKLLSEKCGITLIAHYESINYYFQEEKIHNTYIFLESPKTIDINNETYYSFPLNNFEYNGYDFYICVNENLTSLGEYSSQSFMMIGFNSIDFEICYLYYYNYENRYLCELSATDNEKLNTYISIIDKYFNLNL